MQQVLEQMLRSYEPQTSTDKKNAIKEIIQEIVLCGLSRAGFFKHAAFYGGTALRIFYGLDRFSEDLDFSLMAPEDFDLGEYLPALEKEIRSYGLNFKAEERDKTVDSAILRSLQTILIHTLLTEQKNCLCLLKKQWANRSLTKIQKQRLNNLVSA